MKQFITVHILHFDKLEPPDYMGEEMLHVQGDSFVDGERASVSCLGTPRHAERMLTSFLF